jgi:hypothetical protein
MAASYKQEGTIMKMVYSAETEEDIVDLCDCALSIRALVRQGKKIQQADIGDEFYHDKIRTFTLIETLLEPILTFLCDDATGFITGTKKAKKRTV